VNHGYSTHGGEKSQGNVVMYHHYDIPESKQEMSFSSVWMIVLHLQFGNNWINLEVK
jgi:hypothetical protein